MSKRTRQSIQNEELNQAWKRIKVNLQNEVTPEVYLQFELLEEFPQLWGAPA